jgi:maltooligosyltrehalose synthase
MSEKPKPERTYSIVGPDNYRPPDYKRIVRSLSEAELRSELAAGRGDAGYQKAVRAELEAREREA